MLTKERQQQILSYLSQHNTVTVQELSARLYASASTIRRDLSELEEQGILKRVHGGAVLTAGSTLDTPAQLRKTQQLAEKVKIAELASRFLRPSSTYFFDSSSTSAVLASRLTEYPDVKIATNGVDIIANMSSSPKLSILSCGGYLRSPWGELTGNIAIKSIEGMYADVFFFSCAGFTQEQGAMEFSDENVAVKRAFYRNSKLHILLCDSTKFGKQYFFNLFSLHEIDYIVTDKRPANSALKELLGDRLIYPED